MTRFVRPNHQHTASRVLSASTESGLMVGAPVPDTANDGDLVLRASGIPYEVANLEIRLTTGGGPAGYAVPGEAGGPGARVIYRESGATDWKGHTDTQFIACRSPLTYSAANNAPGTPRELPDGYLGVVVSRDGGVSNFWRVAPDWSATAIDLDQSVGAATYRSDFVVLPSGRLVAYILNVNDDIIYAKVSEDYGLTWAAYGETVVDSLATQNRLCAEVVGDSVVIVLSSHNAGDVTLVFLSTDAGCTFNLVDDTETLLDARTCVVDGVIVTSSRESITLYVRTLSPGGGFSDGVQASAQCYSFGCIVRRDDGVLIALGWEKAAGAPALSKSVSIDGGLTWYVSASPVIDTNMTGYANDGYDALSAGIWRGQLIVLGKVDSAGAADNSIHFLILGEWTNVDASGGTAVGYLPIDVPNSLGWTKTDDGAGATITYTNWLRIVGTAANNSRYTDPNLFEFNSGAGNTVKFRFRVNSGGSITDNSSMLLMSYDCTTGSQAARLRVNTTTIRMVDYTNATLGTNLTIDLTLWTELVIVFRPEVVAGVYTPGATTGEIAVWYRQDADTAYTLWQAGISVPEEAAVANEHLIFGSVAAGTAVNWDINHVVIGRGGDNTASTGFSNPADLTGRSLSSSADFQLSSGINLGGRNTGGVPGDEYTVATTYSRGKEQLWRTILPHRYVASSVDNAAWNTVLDAGANEVWDAQFIGVIGNFRTCTVQFNATNSGWGTPSAEYALSSAVWTGTAAAANTGGGYIGPANPVGWRAGQFKSDGDAHRWFIHVASGAAYEITDNDAGRIYVDGVDLTAETGTMHIFADRMALNVPRTNYRFARVLVGAQHTADNEIRLCSLVMDRPFDLSMLYEHGFVDGMEPNVIIEESDSGYRSTLRRGPRRLTMSVQWGPIDRHVDPFDLRIADFFAALEGQSFVVWRDDRDATAWGFYQNAGRIGMPNIHGEHEHNLGRLDQVILQEVW